MVKDVLDGLKMVSEGVKNVKEIAEAVRDGTNYLRACNKTCFTSNPGGDTQGNASLRLLRT
jgi:hypothetical protein